MEHATLGDIRLEYQLVGRGEPIVFVHGSFIADAFRPLLGAPALDGFQLIAYHRRGYAGSTPLQAVVDIPQQAADCRSLLSHLGVERAHIVGHSFGGVVALQLALTAPALVGTLAVLEPAIAVGASGPGYRASLVRGSERCREAGPEIAVDEALRARWPGYRAPLERLVPGAFEQAVADAPGVFEFELPGLLAWDLDERTARGITQPALSVLGGESESLGPRFGETHRALCAWLPRVEAFVLPGSHHLLQLERPHEMAGALADFARRHPLGA